VLVLCLGYFLCTLALEHVHGLVAISLFFPFASLKRRQACRTVIELDMHLNCVGAVSFRVKLIKPRKLTSRKLSAVLKLHALSVSLTGSNDCPKYQKPSFFGLLAFGSMRSGVTSIGFREACPDQNFHSQSGGLTLPLHHLDPAQSVHLHPTTHAHQIGRSKSSLRMVDFNERVLTSAHMLVT
jgi:hypothetical protein